MDIPFHTKFGTMDTENALRIGDIITLFHGKNRVSEDGENIEAISGGWLCSEGHLGEDCMLTNNIEYIQVDLFMMPIVCDSE